MRLLSGFLPLLMLCVLLGGCVRSGGDGGQTYEPVTREYFFKVNESLGSTIEVYEKNDGTYTKIVASGFMDPDQEALAVPNPEIRVKEGDTVIIHLENTNPLSHTIHLHGGLIPWAMDGVDYLTQMPVMPGGNFTYTFADLKAGTYFYHCHVDGPHHQDLGMYGAFIVEERDPPVAVDKDYVVLLDEMDNCHVHSNTDPATQQEMTGNVEDNYGCLYRFALDNLARNAVVQGAGSTTNSTVSDPAKALYCAELADALADAPPSARDNALLVAGCAPPHAHGTPPPQQTPREWWFETHPVYAPVYNTYLLNGKAFPDTQVFSVKEEQTVRFRLINAGNEMHSMHWHGHKVQVIARDGYLLDSPFYVDTLGIMPGERYDVIMEADNPGLWLFHDHVGLQTQNDDQHPGGIMACIAYDGFEGVVAADLVRSLDCHVKAVEILEAMGQHGGHTPPPPPMARTALGEMVQAAIERDAEQRGSGVDHPSAAGYRK